MPFPGTLPVALGGAGPQLGYVHPGSAMFNRQSSGNWLRWPATNHISNAPNMNLSTVSAWFRFGEIAALAIRRGLVAGFFDVNNFTAIEIDESGRLDWFIFASSSFLGRLISTRVLRDPTAWYHLVLQYDSNNATADNRMRMWLNGVEETAFDVRTNPVLGRDINWVTAGWATAIGSTAVQARRFEGFIADVYHINDALVDPSVFGRFDPIHGEWIPRQASGITFNSASFHVDFADENDMGNDVSGNNNDFTAQGTFGSANSFLDVPAKTYPIGNSVQANSGIDWSVAGLQATENSASASVGLHTHVLPVGKWYWEVDLVNVGPQNHGVIFNPEYESSGSDLGSGTAQGLQYSVTTGQISDLSGTVVQTVATSTTNDVLGFSVHVKESGEVDLWMSKNGTQLGSGSPDPATGTDPVVSDSNTYPYPAIPTVVPFGYSAQFGTWRINYGQERTGLTYAIPAGFKEVNTQNFPVPVGPALRPRKYFGVISYEGDGAASRTITDTDAVDFVPDMVWLKNLDGTFAWAVAINMAGFSPSPSTPNNLQTNTTSVPFDSNNGNIEGFTLGGFDVADGATAGTHVNQNNSTFMAWCWKSDPAAGFEIIRYQGDGVNGRTVPHNLGEVPEWILIKRLDVASNWDMYHITYGRVTNPENFVQSLNLNSASSAQPTLWNNTAPTATVFTVGTATSVNANGGEYVAMVFRSVPGFLKIQSMEGNGNANGAFISTDFAPLAMYAKGWDAVRNHHIHAKGMDPANNPGFNEQSRTAVLNTNEVGGNNANRDDLANGFKWRSTNGAYNANNDHYCGWIYAEVASKFARGR